MCAGITTFNALRNSGARTGDTVAVLGIGGLGHLGVQFSAKMGFLTIAIARGKDKGPLCARPAPVCIRPLIPGPDAPFPPEAPFELPTISYWCIGILPPVFAPSAVFRAIICASCGPDSAIRQEGVI
jgi:hypothetical protein